MSSSLMAIDWSQYVLVPCQGDSPESWGTPKSTYVCAYGDGWSENCLGCCFTVVYFERWTGVNEDKYEIHISGIFFDNDECEECAKNDWLNFLVTILNTKSIAEGITFKQRLNGDYLIDVYSNGRCLDEQNQNCSQENHCCKVEFAIFWGNPGPPYYMNPNVVVGGQFMPPYDDQITPNCPPTPCKKRCRQAVYQLDPTICTDVVDCYSDEGWQQGEIDITYPGCNPPCNLKVVYEYREINDPNCPTPLKEYKIKQISDDCNCDPSVPEEYWLFASDYLIENGPITLPDPTDPPQDYWRVVYPTCIHTYFNGIRTIHTKCSDDIRACCWSKYTVENINGIIKETRGQRAQILVDCPYDTYLGVQCWSLCESLPVIIQRPSVVNENGSDIKFSTKVLPNPTNEIIEILISSEYNGPFNIYCYDVNSHLIFRETHNKVNIEELIKINFNKFYSGTYFYEIKVKGKSCHNGKFSVIK